MPGRWSRVDLSYFQTVRAKNLRRVLYEQRCSCGPIVPSVQSSRGFEFVAPPQRPGGRIEERGVARTHQFGKTARHLERTHHNPRSNGPTQNVKLCGKGACAGKEMFSVLQQCYILRPAEAGGATICAFNIFFCTRASKKKRRSANSSYHSGRQSFTY